MTKYFAYLRTSTDKQELANQEHEILRYAYYNSINIDEFIQIKISSTKGQKQRLIDDLISKLSKGDSLIVTELSRLGRSSFDVMKIIEMLTSKEINVIFLKEGINLSPNNDDPLKDAMINFIAIFVDLERKYISKRTKEALASKKSQGIKLGRPKGIGKSKFDDYKQRITDLIAYGVPTTKIAKTLGFNKQYDADNLRRYIKRHEMR